MQKRKDGKNLKNKNLAQNLKKVKNLEKSKKEHDIKV